MRIDQNKGRIQDTSESPREREYRGRIEKLERQIEDLKRRLPPEPVPLEPKG
jgi:polyhydroxyalkanoate synthesis regulator phasin